MSKVGSYGWLAFRAVGPHPLRALRRRGTGEERFLANYAVEGLAPTALEERAAAEAASACISCGLCESGCSLRGAIPSIRSLGLPSVFRLVSKSDGMVAHGADLLAPCASCTGCEPLCPTGVPITRLVRLFASQPGFPDAPRRAPPAEPR